MLRLQEDGRKLVGDGLFMDEDALLSSTPPSPGSRAGRLLAPFSGVIGRHPGWATPLTHIVSIHLSGCASESSKCLTPSTAFCLAALNSDAATEGCLRTEEVVSFVEGDGVSEDTGRR